jgi:glutamyl-tRNA(Gln) amidotransferase subunit D
LDNQQQRKEGYEGRALSLVTKSGASVGDDVILDTESGRLEGVLMPGGTRSGHSILVIKLGNGYNVGISVNRVKNITLKQKGKEPTFVPPPKPSSTTGLPKVTIIGTGGTIASRIDYRTGGVKPALSAEELYLLVPELSGIADITTRAVFNIYSENLTPKHWTILSEEVSKEVNNGADGVVIAHGTDTMHYTSAALSFALESPPVPVVLVGSQRSSDRPSSDSAINMIGAVSFAANAPFSGVFVIMHSGLGDDTLSVHSGVRVRKMHTSRRDAFQTINGKPVGIIKGTDFTIQGDLKPRVARSKEFRAKSAFEQNVALVKVYPGMGPSMLDGLVDSGVRGVVLEGTGLGHVPRALLPSIQRAIDKGVVVAMTSQCINGAVRMTVYDTGRDLLSIGVLPLGDMLSEVALAKLSWLLGQGYNNEKVVSMMTQNLRGEMADRRAL